MSERYAVVGNPVAHSLSPIIHEQFALQQAKSIDYEKILSPIDAFEITVKQFQAMGGKGMNVTMPFKKEASRLVQQRTERALAAGAVNTVSFLQDGTWFGDNTDGIGLIRDLLYQQIDVTNKRVLLLGAGGAARGVLSPLLEAKPAQLFIANRTVATVEALLQCFPKTSVLQWGSLNTVHKMPFDVIINATSASLRGESLDLSTTCCHAKSYCYDMAYGKGKTPFLQWAQSQGIQHISDGLGMLIEQAAESFRVWHGRQPETQKIRQLLREYYGY